MLRMRDVMLVIKEVTKKITMIVVTVMLSGEIVHRICVFGVNKKNQRLGKRWKMLQNWYD